MPTARRSDRRSWRALWGAIAAVAIVLTVLPGVGHADFESPGRGGATLDVVPSDDLPDPGTVQVVGKGFVPSTPVQVFLCDAGFDPKSNFAPFDCDSLGTVDAGNDGGFSTPVLLSAGGVRHVAAKCANAGPSKCVVYAATDPTGALAPLNTNKADARHHVCFAGAQPCARPDATAHAAPRSPGGASPAAYGNGRSRAAGADASGASRTCRRPFGSGRWSRRGLCAPRGFRRPPRSFRALRSL